MACAVESGLRRIASRAPCLEVQGGVVNSSAFAGNLSMVNVVKNQGKSIYGVTTMAVTSTPKHQEAVKSTKVGVGGESVRVGVLGASGYTGSELVVGGMQLTRDLLEEYARLTWQEGCLNLGQIVRLLATHPNLRVTMMTADRKAGQSLASVFPHLITQDLPDMVAVKDADFSKVDAVFCCLPHGTTQEIIASLPRDLKVVDLSADFRLRNTDTYEEWYNGPHRAPELQKETVYGLTEIYREEVRAARLVANPGCYPTTVQLPLIPLLQAGLIEKDNIIINANSGVSGAGRSAKEANLYTEIAEGINPYGITRHRHVPEIEQGLTDAVGSEVTVSFTPNLMPMSRGMMSTMFVVMKAGASVDDLHQHLVQRYHDEEFVVVLPRGVAPHTHHVRGSNYCLVNVFEDRITGRAIIISVIDNLVKGASGQALQNMNLMMGFPEESGLLQQPLFP